MDKELKGKHIMVLIAMCGSIGAGIGLVTNCAGLFFEPIAEEFGIGKGDAGLTLTICNLFYALGGILCPKILKEKTFRIMNFICMVILVSFTALLSAASDIRIMYLFSGLRGLAAGTIGMVYVTMIINSWFHKNTGLVLSLVLCFSGIVSALLSPSLSSLIQNHGWRIGYLVVAFLSLLFILPSVLLPIGLTPAAVGTVPYGEKEAQVSEETEEKSEVRISLFIMGIVCAIISTYMTSMPQHFPSMALSFGFDISLGAAMISASMAANTLGKIVFGILVDRFGIRISLTLYASLVVAGILCLGLIRTPFFMLTGAVAFGMVYSVAAVGNTLLTRDIFTDRNYGKVYPKISMYGTIANALGASIIGFLYDISGSYRSTLLMVFCMMLSYLVILQLMYRIKQKS